MPRVRRVFDKILIYSLVRKIGTSFFRRNEHFRTFSREDQILQLISFIPKYQLKSLNFSWRIIIFKIVDPDLKSG